MSNKETSRELLREALAEYETTGYKMDQRERTEWIAKTLYWISRYITGEDNAQTL